MKLLKLLSVSSLILGISFTIRFLLTVAIAKYLNAYELGIYSWVVTVFGFAAIISSFGADHFLIRKVPEYKNPLSGLLSSVIWQVQKQSSINSFVLILTILPLAFFSGYFFKGASLYSFELIVILFALPFAAFSLIFSTSLRGFDFPIRGQFIESIVQSGILLLLLLISFNFFNYLIPNEYRTLFLVAIFVLSWVLCFFYSFFSYKKMIKLPAVLVPTKEDTKEWRMEQSSIVVGTLGWSILGRSDVFLLAFLVTPSEVGAYFICLRLSETLMFFSVVVHYVWGGELSNLIQGGKLKQAQVILKKSSRLCIFTSLILTSLALFFAEDMLYFVNEKYIENVFLFRIALIVFFIKGASGIIRSLYYILGEQDFLAKCQWIIGIIFTILVLTAVPVYGIIGCVICFAFCEIIYCLILLIRLHKKHNLSLSPFSRAFND